MGNDGQPLIDYGARTFAGIAYGLVAGTKPWFDVTNPTFAGGAKNDGITDDQPALQAAFSTADAYPGGGIVFLPSGLGYRLRNDRRSKS